MIEPAFHQLALVPIEIQIMIWDYACRNFYYWQYPDPTMH